MLPNATIRLHAELARCREGRAEGILATVVETEGSTYRKAGATMLVPRFGAPIGLLSGGCLEPEIARLARAAWEEGRSRLIEFDLTQDGEYLVGYGKGCAGKVRILLEPLLDDAPWRALNASQRPARRTGIALVYEARGVATVAPGDRVVVDEDGALTVCGRDGALAGVLAARLRMGLSEHAPKPFHEDFPWHAGHVRVAYHYAEPPVTLRLFGAGVDAEPLAAFGATLGWNVFLYDHRPAQLERSRFPLVAGLESYDPARIRVVPGAREAIVIMTHNLLADAQVLAWASAQPAHHVAYVGLLGPAARRDRILRWLVEEENLDALAALGDRLHAPIGMDLGGAGEAAIALAVTAEIQQVMHRASREARQAPKRTLVGGSQLEEASRPGANF